MREQPYAPFPYTQPEPPSITRTPATHSPLADALGASVPFLIHDLVERGGPSSWEWSETKEYADVLAYQGDGLMFGGKKGEAATLFNRLAKAVAVLAFMPGGISMFGTHYEAHLRAASDPPYAPSEAVQP